jgi:hypothetical protein
LIDVAGSTVAAERNITLFLRRVLVQTWVSADTLSFILAGIRDAGSPESEIDQPISAAFRLTFSELAPRVGYPLASEYLRSLVEGATELDRRAVTAAVLLRN